MTAPASSQAHVEAVLDFANLDRDFAAQLLQATQQAERVVNRNLQGITRAAQSSSRDIDRAFRDITIDLETRRFTQGTQQIERGAQQTARQVDRSMQQAEDATNDAGESTGKLGDSFGDLVGKAGGAAAGLLAVGGAMEVIGEAINRSELANKLGAQLDLTKDESAEAGRIAGSVYAQNYGDSMEAVTEATGAVLSSLAYLADQGGPAVEDLTKRVLTFSSTFGTEAAEVAQSANNLIQQGLAKDAPEALDLIAAAFQRVPAQMRDEVLPIIDEYSTNLASLGFSGEAAMGLIVNASQQGAIAMDKVGDALKEFGIRATDIGDTAAQDALKGLGLDAAATANTLLQGGEQANEAFQNIVSGLLSVQDPGEQAAAAIALFGTPLEDLDKVKLPGFLEGLSNSGSAMGDFTGSIDEMGQRLSEGPGAQLELFRRQVQDTLINGLGTAAGYVREHTELFKTFGIAVGVAVAAYGLLRAAAVVSAVSMGVHAAATGADTAALAANRIAMGAHAVVAVAMRAGMLAGAAATGIATAATWAFNAAMAVLTSPITLIIIAIAALVAGIVLLYNKNETFRNFVQAAWAAIQTAVSVAWEFIKVVFAAISQWVTGTLVPTLQNLWNIAVAVFNGIGSVVQYFWATFMQPIINNIALLINAVLIPVFLFLWHTVVEPAFDAMGAVISFWWNNIVGPAFDLAKAGIALLGDAVTWWWQSVVTPAFDAVGSVVSLWWGGVEIIFDKVKSGIGLVGDAFSAAGRIMSGIWDGVVAAMRPAVHAIGSVLSKVPTKIGPIEIPGAGAAQSLGTQLQAFQGGGLFQGRGTGRSDSNLALVSNGEFWVNADATAKHLPLLEAINGGALDRYATGGLVNTAGLKRFAQGIDGADYAWGGWGNGWLTDCSGAASALANYATAQLPAGEGSRSGTGAMSGFLDGLGAQPGIGPKGSLSFGWYTGGPYGGHIAATLPTGEHVEMGGARGNGQFGGAALGADGADFDKHAHLPPEFFDGGDLGGSASVSPGASAALNAGGSGTGGSGGGGGGLSSSGGGGGASSPPEFGIAGANKWAAQQDFGGQARDWAFGALGEIFGQFTEPFGVKSLSDKAVEDLKTAAQALAEARAGAGGQPLVGVMNVNGAGDPQATAAAVVDSLAERMGAVTGRYRNGG